MTRSWPEFVLTLALPVATIAGIAALARYTRLAADFPIGFALAATAFAALAFALQFSSGGPAVNPRRLVRGAAVASVIVFLSGPVEARSALLAAVWPVAGMAGLVLAQLTMALAGLVPQRDQRHHAFLARLEGTIAHASNPVFARLVLLEMSLLVSAFTQWRMDPAARAADVRFSYERSFRGLFIAAGMATLALGAGLHVVAADQEQWQWMIAAAVADLLFLYVLATWKSFWLLPAYLSNGQLVVRAGYLMSLHLDLDQIASVSPSGMDANAGTTRSHDRLCVFLFRRPNVLIELREAVARPRGEGFYNGILGCMDDPASLRQALVRQGAISP